MFIIYKNSLCAIVLCIFNHNLPARWHAQTSRKRNWTTVRDGHLSTEPSWGPVVNIRTLAVETCMHGSNHALKIVISQSCKITGVQNMKEKLTEILSMLLFNISPKGESFRGALLKLTALMPSSGSHCWICVRRNGRNDRRHSRNGRNDRRHSSPNLALP